MGAYMLIVAILTVKFPPDPDAGLTSASIASLTMIYLEAMSYNISWGPVPWVRLTSYEPCLYFHYANCCTRCTLVKSSQLAFVRLVLPLVLPPSGSSTLSSLRPRPTPSQISAGRRSSCSASSTGPLSSLSGSSSRRPRASLSRRWKLVSSQIIEISYSY